MTIQQLFATPQRRSELPADTAKITLVSPSTQESVPPISCGTCHSDNYLVFEQVRPVPPHGPAPSAWDVECWCGRCEEFQGIRTHRLPALPHSFLLRGYGTDI
ncbi:hypothetical protein Q2T94_06085 [Paeniglutamicibacter sulfureus]|uniref:hypothetical protein n=1 Tax=Paeniglutamicibacter sulfureus TaxID=43666 RepID=UPI002666E335|nr:hypothetical protein [Paeniglutamicibacter sulfureus]MDO2933869.1 hypothetical protein [Paeniglutamicibacter sulfureus]